MSQYSLNNFHDETKTKSTETLGIDRNQNEGEEHGKFSGRYRKTRNYLFASLVIVFILLSVCIVLGIFLAVSARKAQSKIEEPQTEMPHLPTSYCYSPDCLQIAAGIARKMNASVDPCKNLFQYACGSWIKDNPIPPSKTVLEEFTAAEDRNYQTMRETLEESSATLSDRSAVGKAKLYFKSCIQEGQVEKTAMQLLKPLIAKYGHWALDSQEWNSTEWNWLKVLTYMDSEIMAFPFLSLYIDFNPRNSSQFMLAVSTKDKKPFYSKS
ncbi:Endothelin-converting enzyme 1 [Acropora cervicornis]|uniref:Endothelin-converting enzyme 1 n=1 Tax=Acropora cervicornis TaxID=6130 RepID=A0AAD9QM00_ACRCE|nr:Endothelin-converting enzyme 1 [Acropora cervicornis]